MSQSIIYEILEELGGEASNSEISKVAKERYPKLSLHKYVSNRLHKLAKWNRIEKIGPGQWKIVQKEKNTEIKENDTKE